MPRRGGHGVVLLLVLGLNFLGLSFQMRTGADVPLRHAFTSLFGGAQQLLVGAGRAGSGWLDVILDSDGLREEQEALRARLARMEWELTVAQGLLARAEGLHPLDFDAFDLGEPTPAEVVAISASRLDTTLTLNRGGTHGIRRGAPVMAASGLAGRIVAVGSFSSQLELLTAATSGVAALTSGGRARGVIRAAAGEGAELVLDYVPAGAAVEVGELVVSSGLDRMVPKGLVIGSVVRVRRGTGLLLDVGVRPAVDFERLERVFILPPVPAAFDHPGGPERVATPALPRDVGSSEPPTADSGAEPGAPDAPDEER